MTISVHRHDGDFERWLEEELPKTVRANPGPSPRATQAAYKASGWMPGRRALGRLAWTVAVAIAVSAVALGAGGAAAVAYTGSADPVTWGKAVVRVVQGYAVVRNQDPGAGPSSQGEEGAVHPSPGSHPSGATVNPAPARHDDKDPSHAHDKDKMDGSSIATGSDDPAIKGKKSKVVPGEEVSPGVRATPSPGKTPDDGHEVRPPSATPASKSPDVDGKGVRHSPNAPVDGTGTERDDHEAGQAGAAPVTSKSPSAEGGQPGQAGAAPVTSKSPSAEGGEPGQAGAAPVAGKTTSAEGSQAGQAGAAPVAGKTTSAEGSRPGQVGAAPVAGKTTSAEGSQAGQAAAAPDAGKTTSAEASQAGQARASSDTQAKGTSTMTGRDNRATATRP